MKVGLRSGERLPTLVLIVLLDQLP